MYELVFTERAVKDLKGLENATRTRIGKKLQEFSLAPFEHAKKLSDARIGGYRFRIGDYRVVFDMDGDKIVVLRVGHRREIYR